MSAVLSLRTTAVICIVRSLLDINDKHLRYRKPAEHLRRCILENSSNVTALELLLQYMTRYYPRAVTSQMLEFLVPFHLTTFDLTKCTAALQSEGQYTSLLPRLSNVKSLIHTEGLLADPLPVSIAVEWASQMQHLTSVTLEECPGVTDRFVSIILFDVPKIAHLNLARCSQITDAAFLNVTGQCPPKLTSLDVSGCNSLTSTAIRLLTELCGPSLRHLNVSLTNMDCTILWYLAGHSLASSVRLASEVRGKINNLADAISSQMDRLIHEFQFITEKLKEMGARETAEKNDDDDDEDSRSDGRPGGIAETDDFSENDEGSCEFETKDEVHEKRDQVKGENTKDIAKSSLSREPSTEKQGDNQEGINDNLKDAHFTEEVSHDPPSVGEKKVQAKTSCLLPDGMNGYLEQHDAEVTSRIEGGMHEDENGSKESGVQTAKQDILMADLTTCVSSSSANDFVVKPVISNSDISTSGDTVVCDNYCPESESRGQFREDLRAHLDTCGKLELSAREDQEDVMEEGAISTQTESSHLQCDTGEATRTKAAVSEPVSIGEVPNKPPRGDIAEIALEDPLTLEDLHEKVKPVTVKSNVLTAGDTTGARLREEKTGDLSGGMSTVKDKSTTDLNYTQAEGETGERSKEPSNDQCTQAERETGVWSKEPSNGQYPQAEGETSEWSKEPSNDQCTHAECETGERSKEPSNDQSFSEVERLKLERDVEKNNEREKEGEDDAKIEPCSHCLHNSSKAHVPTKLFQPHILSLQMDHIEFHADLIKCCFDEFFSANRCLQSVTIANRAMTNELLQVVADNCTDLSFLYLLDCAKVSNDGLAYLLERCKKLKSLYLHGVQFLNNSAFVPILDSEAVLQTLHIAEVHITDGILHKLSKVIGHSLKELNLNWCEDITSQGILSMAENCPVLESFSVRQFQVNENTLRSFAKNCPKMKYLDLSGVEEMTDCLLAEMMPRFRMLKVLDVSWTMNLTNDAVTAILSNCPLLTDLNLAGLKRINEKPFLPIISDINRWRRCQALIKLKLREQKVRESTGQDAMSSDEEYEDLCIPVRSTSYVPLLQRMDLQFCDLVKDNILEEIVAVCRGSLAIIDYYGLDVCPKLLQL